MAKWAFQGLFKMDMTQATVNVTDINGASVYTGLVASHDQIRAREEAGPLAEVATKIIDLFFFELQADGTLPDIQEKHFIVWNSVTYEIKSVLNLGGQNRRLRVETEQVR